VQGVGKEFFTTPGPLCPALYLDCAPCPTLVGELITRKSFLAVKKSAFFPFWRGTLKRLEMVVNLSRPVFCFNRNIQWANLGFFGELFS
jgi:hypothetical protein